MEEALRHQATGAAQRGDWQRARRLDHLCGHLLCDQSPSHQTVQKAWKPSQSLRLLRSQLGAGRGGGGKERGSPEGYGTAAEASP